MKKELKYKNKEWLQEQILKYKNVPTICKKTGFASTSIRRYIKKFEFENLLEKCPIKRYLKLNEDYFENIDSERKAYWLGLLMADGNVANFNNRYCIRITLKNEDTYLVEELKKDLDSEAKIYFDKHNRATLRVWSKKMYHYLLKLGVIPRKTGKEIVPNINKNLINHFFRGYFDGDGTIYKRANRRRHKGTIGFCCQSEKFMIDMLKIINKECNTNINYHFHRSNLYEAKTESFSWAVNIINWMYKDATICMLRKYNRAKEYYNYTCPSLE